MVLVLSLKKKKPAVFDVAYIFIRICYDILIVKNTGKQILLRIIKKQLESLIWCGTVT